MPATSDDATDPAVVAGEGATSRPYVVGTPGSSNGDGR